jgi:hypothetical protein
MAEGEKKKVPDGYDTLFEAVVVLLIIGAIANAILGRFGGGSLNW